MEFPDFFDFTPFNALREKMGATQLGHFEFFDPKLHLTAGERSDLDNGITVFLQQLPQQLPQQLRRLDDGTLAFKNSRVLVYELNPRTEAEWEYHLASCEIYQQWNSAEEDIHKEVGIATAVPISELGHYRVCSHCLHELRYKGFDGLRNRHRQYAQSVQEKFNLKEFFVQYPPYPVRENSRVQLIT